MTSQDFSYALDGASGRPSARLEIIHTREPSIAASTPQDFSAEKTAGTADKAELILHLSDMLPLAQREEPLSEYLKLSEVLGLPGRMNAQKTSLAIAIGEKSPDALMMFITGDLERRALIGKMQSKEFVAAVLARETPPPPPELSPSMNAALQSAHSQGAAAGFRQAGGALGHHPPEARPHHDVAAVRKPVAKDSPQLG